MTCTTCADRPIRYKTSGECGACYQKRWRQENPEGHKAIQRRSYEKNRDEVLRRNAEYSRKNPEPSRESGRRYRAANRAKVAEKDARYRAAAKATDRTADMPEFDMEKPISYVGAHQRVHRWRGAAKIHDCTLCNSRAAQWAYLGGSTVEMRGLVGSRGGIIEVAYSPDPMDYSPLCVSCHVKFDRA